MARKGQRSGARFHRSNITHEHQRNARIPRVPQCHHHRFSLLIFLCKFPEPDWTAGSRGLFRGERLYLLPDRYDVENLTAALPRLTSVELTKSCPLNSCKTTIPSLLSLSIHCLGLRPLKIHFNTRTIVGDAQRLLGGNFRHGKAKCKIWYLGVGRVPLDVDEADIDGVQAYFPTPKEI